MIYLYSFGQSLAIYFRDMYTILFSHRQITVLMFVSMGFTCSVKFVINMKLSQ